MNSALQIALMIAASWITAEFIKTINASLENKKMDVRILLSYGGFPSAHSALVSSLTFSILLVQGFNVSFLLSFVLMTIVLRDVITLRQYIDTNSKHIRNLSNNKIQIREISHTVLEIIAGILIGIIVPSILKLFFSFYNL